LVYRLAWMKQTGNVYVTGDDPEGTNDGQARRTTPRIGTYAMRRCRLGMCSGCAACGGLFRPMHSHASIAGRVQPHVRSMDMGNVGLRASKLKVIMYGLLCSYARQNRG
jgi:hypothetical protein